MRIVTFMGNATYIKEVAVKNKLTDVYIDMSYVYNLKENIFSFSQPSYVESLKNELTSLGINVVVTDTEAPCTCTDAEMYVRRYRIAKMIYQITDEICDDILFVDSDVILNDDVFNKITSDEPIAICIPALMKPINSVVFDFCYSTNMYIPRNYVSKLRHAVKRYIDNRWQAIHPVDIYIHNALGTRKTLYVKGVCHYINGKLYCL